MNTNHVTDALHDYLDGTLPSSELERIAFHLKTCRECRDEAESLKSIIHDLKSLPKEIDVPADFRAALERRLDAVPKLSDGATTNPISERGTPGNVPDATHAQTREYADTRPARVPRFWYFRAAAILAICFTAGAIWWMLKPPEHDLTVSDEVNASSVEAPSSTSDRSTAELPEASEPVLEAGKRRAKQANSVDAKGKELHREQGATVAKSPLRRDATPADKQATEAMAAAPAAAVPRIESRMASGVITGRVTDSSTGEPLVGANVVIVGTSTGANTDVNGRFVITHAPVGKYELRVSFIGYGETTIAQSVGSGTDTTVVDVALNASAVEMSTVVIKGERLKNKLTTSSVQTVSPKTINELSNANSVGDVSKLQAGIVNKGENLYMRGGRAGETKDLRDKRTGTRSFFPGTEFHTEEYGRIYENGFLDVIQNPLSTFSVDVDAASYANVRRFISDGQLPPKDAVRIEELINYFEYDYPEPDEDDPFSVTTEVVRCPWNRDNQLVLIGLQGKSVDAEDMPPGNLVFLIDVSGSMNQPNKLPLVKSAFRMLVKQLRPEDRVSIVVYAGNTGLVLPSTGGRHKGEILSAIDRLEAGGSTAGGEGLRLAYDVARENFRKEGNNRVILATDGDFNVGISSTSELVRFIEERREEGIFLSVLGFGTDNLKDDRMQQLADKGNGAHYYIDNIQEARRVFVGQLTGTLLTIAKDVKVQIEFNPAEVGAYRLIGYENRLLAKEDFNNDRKDAGDIGAGHRVTALYEIVPAGEDVRVPSVDSLKYQRSVSRGEDDELLTLKLRYKEPESSKSKLITTVLSSESMSRRRGSENIRFAAAVAEFGMLLRDSEFKGTSSYEDVLDLARGAIGRDRDGYKEEFLKLVETCNHLRAE
jgi:Ca-activated chloride channel family protein